MFVGGATTIAGGAITVGAAAATHGTTMISNAVKGVVKGEGRIDAAKGNSNSGGATSTKMEKIRLTKGHDGYTSKHIIE